MKACASIFVCLLLSFCANNAFAQPSTSKSDETDWDFRLGAGYPNLLGLGFGVHLSESMALSFDANAHTTFQQAPGITLRSSLDYILSRSGDFTFLGETAVARRVLALSSCASSRPSQCEPAYAWHLELGAGVGFDTGGGELRFMGFVEYSIWDKPHDYDEAMQAFNFYRDLQTWAPGARIIWVL